MPVIAACANAKRKTIHAHSHAARPQLAASLVAPAARRLIARRYDA